MDVVSRYLEKHAAYGPFIDEPPDEGLFSVVVIPCHDEDGLLRTLDSLEACEPTRLGVEVLIVVNAGVSAPAPVKRRNAAMADEIREWRKNRHKVRPFTVQVIEARSLPDPHAGVGLARKVGMDEAARRLGLVGTDGVIVCLDADCTVDAGYLSTIENLFRTNPAANGCSVYFEHPLAGHEFPAKVYEGIIDYELFLRYYKAGLEYSGFPYPYHTVGSCMAVRCGAYCRQGGMNRRRAGEDFYFLHKLFPLGHFFELNTTRVVPSPRPSHRVPFGTGRAIGKFLAESKSMSAYDPRTFDDLKALFDIVPGLYALPGDSDGPVAALPASIRSYLAEHGFSSALSEIRNNSASERAFRKRFFGWFDGFRVLKYVHFARDRFYPAIPLHEAATRLLKTTGHSVADGPSAKDLLMHYRKRDLDGGPAFGS